MSSSLTDDVIQWMKDMMQAAEKEDPPNDVSIFILEYFHSCKNSIERDSYYSERDSYYRQQAKAEMDPKLCLSVTVDGSDNYFMPNFRKD